MQLQCMSQTHKLLILPSNMSPFNLIFLLFSFTLSNIKVKASLAGEPLTAQSSALLYWKQHVSNNSPAPEFLLNKASPLTAAESDRFSMLADQHLLPAYHSDFCKKANLLCSQDNPAVDACSFSYTCSFTYGRSNSKQANLFFREASLKTNVIMPMMDLTDNMPDRSFLPRQLASKLPFSTSKIDELKRIFRIGSKDTTIASALNDCESAPVSGETKKCVASIEDMVDIATQVLGPNVVVRRMENTKGSNANIMVGNIKRINGGKLTQVVSCHKKQFPYLVYYCHSVPNVRAYEVDILDPVSMVKINHGVAICHADTSSWSPDHVAFKQLGSAPGKIEVCHWTFESGMIWNVAD